MGVEAEGRCYTTLNEVVFHYCTVQIGAMESERLVGIFVGLLRIGMKKKKTVNEG